MAAVASVPANIGSDIALDYWDILHHPVQSFKEHPGYRTLDALALAGIGGSAADGIAKIPAVAKNFPKVAAGLETAGRASYISGEQKKK